MRILVSGGTGFIGSHLVRALVARGDVVTVLTRDAARASAALPPGAGACEWNPFEVGHWFQAVEGQDAVVHLAGRQAVGVRYTEAVKSELFESRVKPAKLLCQAIAAAEHRPKVFVSASGVGFYGSDLSAEPKAEGAPVGADFLATLCEAWEAASAPCAALGLRVAAARFGVVLAADGGGLPKMAAPFRWGVGGPLGSGKQGFSWIHRDDALAALLLLLDNNEARGPFNVCAPNPLSNRAFSKKLAAVLRRPCGLAAPSFALRLLFGDEGAIPLLGGQYAIPEKLQTLQFHWRYPEAEAALRSVLAASDS